MARRIRRTNRKNSRCRTNRKNSKRLNSRRRTNRKNSKRLNSRRRTNRKNSKRLNSRRRSKVLNRKRTMKRSKVKYQKGGDLVMVDGRPTNFTYNKGNYECLLVDNTLPLFIGDKIKVDFETLPKELNPVALGNTLALGTGLEKDLEGTINGEYELPFSAHDLGIVTKISLKGEMLKITEHEKTGSNRPKNTAGIELTDEEILDIIRTEAAEKKAAELAEKKAAELAAEAAELAAEEATKSPEGIKKKEEQQAQAQSELIEILKTRGKTRDERREKFLKIEAILNVLAKDGITLNIDLDETYEEEGGSKTLKQIITENFGGSGQLSKLMVEKLIERLSPQEEDDTDEDSDDTDEDSDDKDDDSDDGF